MVAKTESVIAIWDRLGGLRLNYLALLSTHRHMRLEGWGEKKGGQVCPKLNGTVRERRVCSLLAKPKGFGRAGANKSGQRKISMLCVTIPLLRLSL